MARAWIVCVTAVVAASTLAANAAELPLAKIYRSRSFAARHIRTARRPLVHAGYYWGSRGYRWGGTAGSWYGSSFVFAGGPWSGGPARLVAASPPGVAAIKCPADRPYACLAEPITVPVAVVERPHWR